MKLHCFRLRIAAILILLSTSFLFSQTIPETAVESPFSTALYLLSATDKDDREAEKACLAASMVSAGKYDALISVVEMVEEDSYVDEDFAALANTLIDKGRISEASELVSFLLKKADGSEYDLKFLFKPLIRLNRGSDALEAISNLTDSDKIDSSFELAKIYMEFGQAENALSVIKNIVHLVEESKYDEDRADLALNFAQLGKKEDALRFLNRSLENLKWQSGKPEYDEGRILDRAIDTYRILVMNKEADDLLARQGVVEEPATQFEIARSYFRADNYEAAETLFESLLKNFDPANREHRYEFATLAEVYLKRGAIDKAEAIARRLIGNDNIQQTALLQVADELIKSDRKSEARKVLQFATQQTQKIDTSEEENGNLWTSAKMDQARYQAEIAKRFTGLQDDAAALRLISGIKKPYLKAQMLTNYVDASKDRLSGKALASHLETAVKLLRQKKTDIFDSRRFDVYGAVALGFAKLGMDKRSDEVFAEAISTLDREMITDGTDGGLLFGLCSIGVEFEKSGVKPNEGVKAALRTIIKNWENDEY